jgi:hypothetical protein
LIQCVLIVCEYGAAIAFSFSFMAGLVAFCGLMQEL